MFYKFPLNYLDVIESEVLCSLKSATIAPYFSYCIRSYKLHWRGVSIITKVLLSTLNLRSIPVIFKTNFRLISIWTNCSIKLGNSQHQKLLLVFRDTSTYTRCRLLPSVCLLRRYWLSPWWTVTAIKNAIHLNRLRVVPERLNVNNTATS